MSAIQRQEFKCVAIRHSRSAEVVVLEQAYAGANQSTSNQGALPDKLPRKATMRGRIELRNSNPSYFGKYAKGAFYFVDVTLASLTAAQ